MEGLLQLNKIKKRGLSEMVGYAILIVIAIGLSVLVYAFLKLYIPKDAPQCQQGVSLKVQEATCSYSNKGYGKLEIKLHNNGLFDVHAAYIRIREDNRKIGVWINNPEDSRVRVTDFYLYKGSERKLSPGETSDSIDLFTSKIYNKGNYILEIQPAQFHGNYLATCENTIIYPIECT